jgi:hypothetical protein
MKTPELAQQAFHAAREVVDRMKAKMRHPSLRASLETVARIQETHRLRAQ